MTHPDPIPSPGVTGTEPIHAGPLSHVLAIRGSMPDHESRIVVEHREALVYLLGEAAELEHAILCEYLFAAFSLKQATAEGLTEDQLYAVKRWRQTVLEVAAQEMLHLALVQNLLTAIGASPHLTRPNLPAPARHFPPGVQIALVPFGEAALRHFLYLERPEGMEIEDAEGFAALDRAEPLMMDEEEIVPRGQGFATVGHLYRSIEDGFVHLTQKLGEDRLFIGPPRAQATAEYFRWPDLVSVIHLKSAQQAIETIVEQGEGASGDWKEAHFGRFHDVLDEYLDMRRQHPTFEPTRSVMAANVRPPESGADVPIIGNRTTAKVVDLFNVTYEILLQILYRFFAHTEETDEQLRTLADLAVTNMFILIEPLGQLITSLPVGPQYPGMMAGATFELFYETDYLFPHQQAAWILLEERLQEAADFARRIAAENQDLSARLEHIAAGCDRLAHRLAAGR
jgi:Ferritin-like